MSEPASAFDRATLAILNLRPMAAAVRTAEALNPEQSQKFLEGVSSLVADFTSIYQGRSSEGFLGSDQRPRWALTEDGKGAVRNFAWVGPSSAFGFGRGVVGPEQPFEHPYSENRASLGDAVIFAKLLMDDFPAITAAATARLAQRGQATEGLANFAQRATLLLDELPIVTAAAPQRLQAGTQTQATQGSSGAEKPTGNVHPQEPRTVV